MARFFDNFLVEQEILGGVIPLHGDIGLEIKLELCKYFSSINHDGKWTLPILIATAPENCVIISEFSRLAVNGSITHNIFQLCQNLG